jgi:hypothetical protein
MMRASSGRPGETRSFPEREAESILAPRIKGASVEKSPERPVLTVAQVYALADAVGPRYRALILLACFAACAGENWPSSSGATSTPHTGPCVWHASFVKCQGSSHSSPRPSPTLASGL